MSYICLDCGNIFEEGEQITFQENMGEHFGVSCSKKISGCPLCGGEYEESTPCVFCGSEHLEEDLNGGLCDECIDKYKNDIEMCFKIGQNDDDKVELNCFLASVFDKEDIEKVLFRELKEREKYAGSII
jgi:DNA-directed RNA polymerase subunit RPC12/RpoP